MCKKLIVLLFVLAFVGSASAANIYWFGATSYDWATTTNWGGTAVGPTSADWTDIRSDTWYGRWPVVFSGTTAAAGTIRMNPGYGTETARLTVMGGGSLTVESAIYVGDSGGPALLTQNGGTITSPLTMVGAYTGNGVLRVNGGTLNAGALGIPMWWGPTTATGKIYIDGGLINTAYFAVAGAGNAIQFTKNLTSGGGKIVDVQDINDTLWDAWQVTVNALVSGHQIFSDVGDIVVNYSSIMESRTTEIYSNIPEPMSIALLGFGGLLLRRRRRN